MPTPRPSTVRLLLLDADAVIQRMPDTWRDDALAHLAAGWGASADDLAADTALWGRTRAVLDEIFVAEVSLLSGGEDDPTFPEVIAAVLDDHDNSADPEATAALWHNTVALEEERAMVVAARQRGLRVAMATNQQPHRAAWLDESRAFAEISDAVYTSSGLGAAKPDPEFFRRILAAEADAGFPVRPEEVVFVDDRPDNVAGAAEVGITAREYHFDQGPEMFAEVLQSTGVLLLSMHDGPSDPAV
ncbi:HAD family hydrolase [Kytococcus sedentarius]|uniref:HAD family hydrolase n=1 Tax=Kytococcus sedentarius TaxID=1276 RepID=UPI00194DC771|nr:HAD family hydrolase [Kytococcus sedentarius]QRO86943.1 HAD family hydrolase [Kytococcus sedentarius]